MPTACGADLHASPAQVACRAPLLPIEPGEPTDPAPPQACDDLVFAENGAFVSHASSILDAAGRPVRTRLLNEAGVATMTTSSSYDACGDVLASETLDDKSSVIGSRAAEFGADGLLRRLVTTSYSQCSDASFGYRTDAQGRVIAVYDPRSCKDRMQIAYDDAGRVSRADSLDVSGTLIGGPVVSEKTYSYYANGALKAVSFRSAFGYYYDHTYDQSGHLVESETNQDGGSTIDDLQRVWTYDGAGKLVRFTESFQGVGCKGGAKATDYQYDAAGNLSRTRAESSWNTTCETTTDEVRVTSYGRPSPDVLVAEVSDGGGARLWRTTTTFDAAGRPVRTTFAAGPTMDQEVVVELRDYSCLAAAHP